MKGLRQEVRVPDPFGIACPVRGGAWLDMVAETTVAPVNWREPETAEFRGHRLQSSRIP